MLYYDWPKTLNIFWMQVQNLVFKKYSKKTEDVKAVLLWSIQEMSVEYGALNEGEQAASLDEG